MKKRILSIFMAFCMALLLFPTTVYAETDQGEESYQPTVPFTVAQCTHDSYEITEYGQFICKNCKAVCSHANRNDNICSECGQTITARLSYNLDGTIKSDYFTDVVNATKYYEYLDALPENSGKLSAVTITLLTDNTITSSGDYAFVDKAYTLDIGRYKLTISDSSNNPKGLSVPDNAEITIRGNSGAIETASVTVESGGKLRLNGTMLDETAMATSPCNVTVKSGGTITLDQTDIGGKLVMESGANLASKISKASFGSGLELSGMTAADLLADGSAYYSNNVLYSRDSTDFARALKIDSHTCTPDTHTNGVCGCGIKCLHTNRNSSNQCINCGATIYAEYKGVYYTDLKDAVNALTTSSTTDGDIIKLLNDCVEHSAIIIDNGIACTIDLNGFKLSNSWASADILKIYGSVVITDSSNADKGQISYISLCSEETDEKPKLTINEEVTITEIRFAAYNDFELKISDGIFTNAFDIYYDCVGSMTISGGVFKGKLTLRSPKVNLKLSGGEFTKGIDCASERKYLNSILASDGTSRYFYTDADGKYFDFEGKMSIGIYVKVLPHDHHQLTDAANCKCVCKTELAVGIIDGNVTNYYPSLQEAISNSDDHTTIQLIKDLAIDDIPDDNAYDYRTLDLNGFKLSKNGGGDLAINASGWTFTDNSTTKSGEVTSAVIAKDHVDIAGGIFHGVLYTQDGSGSITGGTFNRNDSKGYAVKKESGTAAGLLDGNNGFTYVRNNQTYWMDKNSDDDFNDTGSVKPLPITSISATIEDGNLTYDYSNGNTPLMTVSATPLNAGSTITYSWYRTYNAVSTTPNGDAFATTASCRIPAFTPAIDVGTVYFMAAATCEGYTKYSAPIAVTVLPRTLTGDMFAVADTPVTFKPKTDGTGEGVEQYPVLTTALAKGMDYRFTSGGTEAGSNTAVIEGMGNYAGSVNKTWYMAPAVITNVDITIADKSYDGNTFASVSTVSITANGTTITLDPQYYQVSAQFASASVGNHNVNYSFKILSNNYTFANGSSTTTGTATGTILKNSSTPNDVTLYVKNGVANNYSFDLSQLLHTLNTGCSYGMVSYSIDTSRSSIKSDYLADGGATIVNDVLILPIKAYATDIEGSIGKLYINIVTDNYNVDQAAEIEVLASNKTPLVGTPVLGTSTITYGQKLSTIALSGSMTSAVDSNVTVGGTFYWVFPNQICPAGNYDAEWLFTPDDADTYLSASGTIAITVNKVDPIGTPSYTPILEAGKKLSDAGLGIGTINVSGSISWNDDAATGVIRGASYGWTFTPDDADNYSTLTGSIILWPADTGSGQAAVPSVGNVQGGQKPAQSNAKRPGNDAEWPTSQPFIKGENGKAGWDVIRQETEGAEDGGTVTVDMNGTSIVPGNVLASISGRDVTVVFDLGGGVTWRVNGRNFTGEEIGDIDFGVTLGAGAGKSIPVTVINKVSGEHSSINLTLAYEGAFGFEAVLTIHLDAGNAGLYANLFYYNPETGALEFISAGEIDGEGNTELAFTHASDYTIVIDAAPMDGTASEEEENHDQEAGELPADAQAFEETQSSGWMWIPVLLLLLAVLTAGGVVFAVWTKRKEKKEEKEEKEEK